MIKRRNLIWLIPLALTITFPAWRIPVAGFLAPRHGSDYSAAQTAGHRQDFTMETVKILQSKSGRITAEIRAEKAFTTRIPDEYILDTVEATLLNNRGESTFVTAENGIFDGASQQLTLKDEVVITKNGGSQQLFTDLLYYDDGRQLVNCPGSTRLLGEDIDITGTGLDYDVEKGVYQLGGRVLCLISGSISP
jgi:LPS export ABC transporter protein LptC